MAKYQLHSLQGYAKLVKKDRRTITNWLKDPKKKLNLVIIAGKKFIKTKEITSENSGGITNGQD